MRGVCGNRLQSDAGVDIVTNQNALTLMAEVIIARRKREATVQSNIEKLCEALGYDVEREYPTGAGRADLYLPGRRTIIETKGSGQAAPDKPGGNAGETQEEQCGRYIFAENERERGRLDLEGNSDQPWQAMLTDGRQWWVWKWPVNHDGSLAGKSLTDARTFVTGQEGEALAWLQDKAGERVGKPWVPRNPNELFDSYLATLNGIYRQLRNDRVVITKRHLWLETLNGSGCAPEDDAQAETLFLQHTLLITVARAVVNTLSRREGRREPIDIMAEGFASWPQARNEYGPTHRAGVEWTNSVFATVDGHDWRQRAQDVMRTLYQGLIPGEQRKAFGEYYTPDWLAAMLAERVIDDQWIQRAIDGYLFSNAPVTGVGVLDPACGSGTFLYHAARRILDSSPMRRSNATRVQQADFIAKLVNGIDIHPIAAEISRATLMRALPAEPSGGPDALQVYQGDALIYNRRNLRLSYNPDLPFYTISSRGDNEIKIPVAFAASPIFGQSIVRFVQAANAGLPMPPGITTGLNERDAAILSETFEATTKICREEGNSVWAWYIFNAVSPTTLAQRKVDRILSNPPWVVLTDIRVEERRQELEALSHQLGIREPRGKFDIAALFVKRCRENYLVDQETAEAAWVLNRAALTASNWEKAREDQGEYTAEWLDFSKVKAAPFSGAASCAWIQKATDRSTIVHWNLLNRDRNLKVPPSGDWPEVKELTKLQPAQTRLEIAASAYLGQGGLPPFRTGFKFEPYCLVNIDKCDIRGDTASIKTVPSRHEPWKSEGIQRGDIPARWVRDMAHRSELTPFNLGPHQGVIPLTADGEPDPERESNEYWRRALAIYERHVTASPQTPQTLFDRLNFQNKLLEQSENAAKSADLIKVFYNASGQILRAARSTPQIIAESGLLHATFDDPQEAAYLVAMLNAPCLQLAYQQSRKSDRDFVQHFWRTVPIPVYDAGNADHQQLAALCGEAEAAAQAVLTLHGAQFGQITLSSRIRQELINRGIAGRIDDLARKIVPGQSEQFYEEGYHPWLTKQCYREVDGDTEGG